MSKKARDLLPPDDPPPVEAEDVRPADDDLEVEVETRKIGIRRVTALDFADRLTARNRWRPAGNSRRFWRQIEADDPFKKRPARPTDAPLDVYPAQRIQRVEGSMPKPQPEVAKSYPPPARGDQPAPARPMRETPRPTRTAPAPVEPVHTPEPRPVAAPSSVVPEPAPEAVPAPPAPTQMPRHLPPKKPPGGKGSTRTGRQRMPSAAQKQAVYGKGGKTAAQIREEKMQARAVAKKPDKPEPAVAQKSLDSYREMLQNLAFSQDVYERGEEAPEVPVPESDGTKPVKIKGEVKRRPKRAPKQASAAQAAAAQTASATPAPAAPQPPPRVDRTPPKVAPTKDEPVDRTPRSAGNHANLDDLFGGGGDRVRIGKRVRPSEPKADDEEA